MTTEALRILPHKCQSCSADLANPVVCTGCHTLQPLPTRVDHFELLGLPRTYAIEPADVSERFLALSRHVHPDYFSAADAQMRSLSTRLSAELNEAVRVLQDPLLRAGYLLELCGGPSAAEDRTVAPEVLAEAIMLREEIDEAIADQQRDAVRRLQHTVEQRKTSLLADIADLAGRLPEGDDLVNRDLRHKINAARYYYNMADVLDGA